MLFDLTSPRRKNVVRVVFGTLAAVFGLSFVFLGVGSDFGGDFTQPLRDLFGADDPDENPFDNEIEDIQKRLQANPNDTAALAELVSLYYQSGSRNAEQDAETGLITYSSEGEDELRQGGEAWNRYVKAAQGNVNSSTALFAFRTYTGLAYDSILEAQQGSSTSDVLRNAEAAVASWKAAAQSQQLIVEQQPSADIYLTIADSLYRAGDVKGAEAAAAQAKAMGTPKQAKQVDAALEQAQQLGTQISEAITRLRKQQATQEEQLGGDQGNPLEGIGSGGGLGGGGLGAGGTGLAP